MDANALLEALEPLFNSYQHTLVSRRHGSFVEDRVSEVYRVVHEFGLQQDKNITDSDEELLGCLSEVLLHFFDCTICMDYVSDTKDAMDAMFQLLAAVAARYFLLAQELLDRAIECSQVLSEKIRSCACRSVGSIVSFVIDVKTTDSTFLTADERDQLLDMASQALLPRFTDKAQSVRLVTIQSAGFFFSISSSKNNGDKELEDDPDLRQALQWSLQHDPSVANRVAALEALPATVQTSDLILSRLRDIKEKVREKAIERLSDIKVTTLDSEQCAVVIEAACNERCLATKQNAQDLICTKWMKEVDFDPIRLVRHVGVVGYEDTCEKLVLLLLNVDKTSLSSNLSKKDVQSYRDAMETAGAYMSGNSSARVYDVSQVFFSRLHCQNMMGESDQSGGNSQSSLDIDAPSLCEQFETNSRALMRVIVEEENSSQDHNEEELVCTCMNLLQFLNLVDLEEGARIHLKSTMKQFLQSLAFPEDLVGGSIKAFYHVIGNREEEFWQSVADILNHLWSLEEQVDEESSDAAELKEAYFLRVLSIVSTVCENVSFDIPSASVIPRDISSKVTTLMSHQSPLVREAAIGCMGRLALTLKDQEFASRNITLMSNLAVEEPVEIRIQAFLALADWSMIFSAELETLDLILELLPSFLQHEDLAVVCLAAEATMKLCFCGKVQEAELLGKLLLVFFDNRIGAHDDIDGGGDEDAGDPARLQQMLSIFFPAVFLRGNNVRKLFVDFVSSTLQLCFEKDKQKGKRGTKAAPVSKMLDYLLDTAGSALNAKPDLDGTESNSVAVDNTGDGLLTNSCLGAELAILLGTAIHDKHQQLSSTMLRACCKYLGKIKLDLTDGDILPQISLLSNLMQDLESILDDNTSKKSLAALTATLSKLETRELEGEENDENVDDENIESVGNTVMTEKVAHDSQSRGIIGLVA